MRTIMFLLFTLSMLMQGCGGRWSAVNIDKPFVTELSEQRVQKDYQLGVIRTANIGQELLRVKLYKQGVIIGEVSAPIDLSIDARYQFKKYKMGMEKDRRTTVEGSLRFNSNSWETNSGDIYHLVPIKDSEGKSWALLMGTDGKLSRIGMYNYEYNLLYISFNTHPVPLDFKFELIPKQIDVKPAGSYELIFSGKNDVSINATYREYTSEDIARPAFYQNITYQADAKQIRFKDFIIQIHNISNEQITYSIIGDSTKL